MNNAMLLTDGYKLDHRRQYPEGTECVYANWTPRSSEHLHEAKDGCVVFGIQYFIKRCTSPTHTRIGRKKVCQQM